MISNWRNYPCDKVINKSLLPSGDFYQFGVFTGTSMKVIIHYLHDRINKSFGFDSFEGLPQENNDKFNNRHWVKGFCNVQNKIQGDIKQQILDFISFDKKIQNKVNLIEGWFNKTLTKENIEKYQMAPASIIDIDCDIYTSTYEALEFMFTNKLVQIGTLILYDDWGGTLEWKGGESRAHKELTEKYGIVTQEIYSTKGQKIFRITKIN